MAETTDPNASPTHHEIETRFSALQMALCGLLGSAALIAGVVLGLVLAND